MKKIYSAFAAASLCVNVAFSQDCSGNRYSEAVFESVESTLDVQYGSNFAQDGTTNVNLKMDIYQPSGDVATNRPVVVLAHGGSFIGGSKADMATMCQSLAKMGYVAVSIQYRLLTTDASVFADLGGAFQKEVVRAVHDMRAAIRFLRKSAIDGGNPYGINPGLIIVGGSSAGAILANHVTYLNKDSEIPTNLTAYMSAQGGLEGNSGNSGYSSVPQMVVSMCGAIMDVNWMEAGDQPFIGIHNVGDPIVPNLSGQPTVMISIPVTLMGDSLMYKRALEVDIVSDYRSYPGDAHCDFPTSSFSFITDFMHEQICMNSLATELHLESELMSVYPNPARDVFFIDLPGNKWNWSVEIINTVGQVIESSSLRADQNRMQIGASNFQTGVYLVKLKGDTGKEILRKLVIQ